jgi:hypothetical protein
MNHPIPSTVRVDDLLRHLEDLRSGTYEGAMSRGAKEVVYRQGINLLRSDAVEILRHWKCADNRPRRRWFWRSGDPLSAKLA